MNLNNLNADEWDKLSYSEKLSYQELTPFDCSFAIGTGENEKIVTAHKSVLSRSSTVFESMFNGNYKEAEASFNIPLPNVLDYSDFEAVLEYIYFKKTEYLELLNMERLKNEAYLAHYFMLDKLLDECHKRMESKMKENSNRVNREVSFYDYLQVFEYEKKLKRKVECFGLLWNISSIEIMTTTSVYDFEPQHFYDLLKLLQCSEFERFCLIENYAKIHRLNMGKLPFQNTQNPDSSVDDANPEAAIVGKTLSEMFELINFRSMSAREFGIGPAVSKVWIASLQKKNLILAAIISRGSYN